MGTTLDEFTAAGFDPCFFNEENFRRRRVRPRTILYFSTGADLLRQERTSLNVQFNVQNLTNELFLYNFESVFSGTQVSFPRLFSGGHCSTYTSSRSAVNCYSRISNLRTNGLKFGR